MGLVLKMPVHSINTAFDIRNAAPVGKKGEYHPFLNKLL